MDPTQLASAQDGLNKASNTVNKGFMGALTKTFMGQKFVDQTNAALASGQSAMNMAAKQTALYQTGVDATAMVLSIQDTGRLMNFDPVLKLGLKVTPLKGGEPFDLNVETWVSKIMIPRVGDMINIKYDPADTNNIMVMGVVPPAMQAQMGVAQPMAPMPPAPDMPKAA